MKKRSPAGKKIDRLSKNTVTERRPPCQARGTPLSTAKRRLRTSSVGCSRGYSMDPPCRARRKLPRFARSRLLSFRANAGERPRDTDGAGGPRPAPRDAGEALG